jgi:hypothetical protein
MSQLLTDEEIRTWFGAATEGSLIGFARAIERGVLAKLGAQEPPHRIVPDSECQQGKCANVTTGCSGECQIKSGRLVGLSAIAPVALGWRDVANELPKEAQEVLFVRGDRVLHGAWIGGIFWHSNTKMAAAKWMPLPSADLPTLYAAQPIPAGMALVPIEPTDEMHLAFKSGYHFQSCYAAMLAAAEVKP